MIDCQGGDHRDAPHRGQERPPARGAERGSALSMRSERLSRRATDSESSSQSHAVYYSPSQSRRSQVVHLNRPRRWVKVEVKSRYCAPQSVKVTLQEAVTSHARFWGVTPTLNRKLPRTPCDATGASAALHGGAWHIAGQKEATASVFVPRESQRARIQTQGGGAPRRGLPLGAL